MSEGFLKDFVLWLVSVVLVVDLVVRILDVRAGKLMPGLRNRIGILPLPILACVGVLVTLYTGWLGWVLGVIAGLAAISNLQITNMPETSWEYPLLNGALVFAHILVTAVCLRALLVDGIDVLGVLYGAVFG